MARALTLQMRLLLHERERHDADSATKEETVVCPSHKNPSARYLK